MLQILANDDPTGAVGKPAVFRSGFGSVLFHLAVLTFLVALQYFSPAVLPARFALVSLVAPAPPPPPPPPLLAKPARTAAIRPARVFIPVLTAPVSIPQHAAQIVALADAPPSMDTEGVVGGIPGGIAGGIPGGVIGGLIPAIAPPPPPPPPPPVVARTVEPPPEPVPTRIQVDSGIQEAKLLTMVQPVYPEMAKQARIQGSVRIKAVIDREGKISEMQVISGNPLLIAAARSAVSRWRYQPTLLHGQPVEVLTEIIVQFHLVPIG